MISTGETAIVVGIVAVAHSLMGVVKFLVNKIAPNTIYDKVDNIEVLIQKLYDMHDHTDLDGIPVWFVPRRSVEMQAKMLELLSQMLNDQKVITQQLSVLSKAVFRVEKEVNND